MFVKHGGKVRISMRPTNGYVQTETLEEPNVNKPGYEHGPLLTFPTKMFKAIRNCASFSNLKYPSRSRSYEQDLKTDHV